MVAATDDSKQNHQISEICRKKKIPVNAVDQIEDCSFIFPSYRKEGEVVAAFSSGGQSPVITQYLKEQMRFALTPLIGELAACLGALRERIRQDTNSEKVRKKIYQELLKLGLEHDTIPSEEEIEEIIERYKHVETESLENKERYEVKEDREAKIGRKVKKEKDKEVRG